MKPYQRRITGIRWMTACVLSLFVVISPLFSQVTVFPVDYQLYPRNPFTNKATISVAGTLNISSGCTQVRLKRYRNTNLQKTTIVNLVYVNGIASYAFSNDITAELANYSFRLYTYKQGRETQIKVASFIVAGDAYIVQGQSNAVANLRGTFSVENDADDPTNSPNRNFVRVYGSAHPTAGYTKAWFIGKGNANFNIDAQTGQWAMRMASNIAGARKIPVAIFNGASPGQKLSYFYRNDALPTDLTTNYGRLLARIKEAGFQNNIRAVIWHQGESDVLGALSPTQMTTSDYKTGFNSLKDDWKTDYPGLAKFYLLQIRFGCGMSNADNCLKIQEAQRQLDKESTEIVTLGTANTNQLFDGGDILYCHYNFFDGYKNMGDWTSKLIRRDLYNEFNQPATIESPEPVSASFTRFDGQVPNQIGLVLKDQASAFTTTGDLSPLIRLDGGAYTVTAASINGNTLLVDFSRNLGTSTNPQLISFRSHDQVAAPVLTNTGGLALINFENLAITQNIPESPACPDLFEPNNTINTTAAITINTTYTASIGSATDEDWYRFRTWSPWKYIRFNIWNMAADYDLYLYDDAGNFLTSSTVSGTAPEALVYNNGGNNVYYRLKVVSKSGQFRADLCYSFRQQANDVPWPLNGTPYSSVNPATTIVPATALPKIEKYEPAEITTFPNPATSRLYIKYPAKHSGAVDLLVFDLTGRQLIQKKVNAAKGQNLFELNISGMSPGTYLLQIRKGGMITTKKFQVVSY